VISTTSPENAVNVSRNTGRNVSTVAFLPFTDEPQVAVLGNDGTLTTHAVNATLDVLLAQTVMPAADIDSSLNTDIITSTASPDGKRLAFASSEILQVHESSDLSLITNLTSADVDGAFVDLVYSPSTTGYLLLAATEKKIYSYDEISDDDFLPIRTATASSDGNFSTVALSDSYLALGKTDGTIDVHNATNPSDFTAGIDPSGNNEDVASLAFGGNLWFGAAYSSAVYVWPQPKNVSGFAGASSTKVSASGSEEITFTSNGSQLIWASSEESTTVFNVSTPMNDTESGGGDDGGIDDDIDAGRTQSTVFTSVGLAGTAAAALLL
jgi:hypothetical protein